MCAASNQVGGARLTLHGLWSVATLSIAGAGLPYRQTNTGSVNPTASSWRVLILSSIGLALPAGIVSGVPSSTDFNAIWNWNDAGSALPASSTWSGWPGKAEDIKLQRVSLPSFHPPGAEHLCLTGQLFQLFH